MATVNRFDRGTLSKPVKLKNGWLRVDAYLTRSGVFDYMGPDGKILKEYRPPEEVFHADSVESFRMVPFVNEHPPEGMLNATNTRLHQRGSVELPAQDADKLRASILVTDEDTIAEMERGKVEISCGYLAEMEDKPGVAPSGERYDCVQRKIRGNHVALVREARAGPTARVRMDSASAAMVVSDSSPDSPDSHKAKSMIKFKIDGVDYEVSPEAAQAFAKVQAAHDAALAAATDASTKVRARADAADAALAEVKKQLTEAPAKIREEMKARVELEGKAAGVLGKEEKFDGVSDDEIKRKVIAQVSPTIKLDGKDATYIAASFDHALARFAEEAPSAFAGLRTASAPVPKTDAVDSLEAHKAVFEKACREAHLAGRTK